MIEDRRKPTTAEKVIDDAVKVAEEVINKATETAAVLVATKDKHLSQEFEHIGEALKEHSKDDVIRFAEAKTAREIQHSSNLSILAEQTFDLKTIKHDVKEIKDQSVEHSGRLSSIEKKIYMIIGGLIVVSAIVVPLFLNLLK